MVATNDHISITNDLNRAALKIIHPKKDLWINKWNLLLAAALGFTALITPFEIAFLQVSLNGLFVINRLIDFTFFADIWINFRLAFWDSNERKYVTDPQLIRRHYMRSWFLLDAISTIPWDIFDVVDIGADVSDLKVLRIAKLIKLTKLFRMIKASRSMKAVQEALNWTNEGMNFFTKIIAFLLTIHWIACFWGLGVTFQSNSWADNKMADLGVDVIGPDSLYVYCLCFSVTSMVMGESENAIPFSDADRVMSCCCMIVGGSVYAYLIGSVCGLISERDPASKEFKDACDLIHKFCREKQVSPELTAQLKEYFLRSEDMFRDQWYRRVYVHMPPSLQKSVALETNGTWVGSVAFLNAESQDEREAFTAHIVQMLEPRAFPPKEEIFTAGHVCRSMMIVTKGMATKSVRRASNVLKTGSHFGDEMILENATLPYTVTAITYLNTNQLHQQQLMDFMKESKGAYPQTRSLIRKSKVRLTFLRSLAVINEYFRNFHEVAKLAPEQAQKIKEGYKTIGRRKHKLAEETNRVEKDTKVEKIERLRKKLGSLTTPDLAMWLQPKIERRTPEEIRVEQITQSEPNSPVISSNNISARITPGVVNPDQQQLLDAILASVSRLGQDLGAKMERIEKRVQDLEARPVPDTAPDIAPA
jgi:CRP-like cAMP-binding protein